MWAEWRKCQPLFYWRIGGREEGSWTGVPLVTTLSRSMGTGPWGTMPTNGKDFWVNGVDLVGRKNMGFQNALSPNSCQLMITLMMTPFPKRRGETDIYLTPTKHQAQSYAPGLLITLSFHPHGVNQWRVYWAESRTPTPAWWVAFIKLLDLFKHSLFFSLYMRAIIQTL